MIQGAGLKSWLHRSVRSDLIVPGPKLHSGRDPVTVGTSQSDEKIV
jgi:hypothetical protein